MVPAPAHEERPPPRSLRELNEYFAPQCTPAGALPDPSPLIHNLAMGVLEVLAGVREIEQLARWLSEDAYRVLVRRASLATRARGLVPMRPNHRVLTTRADSPADGVVEAVVVVQGPARSRAIALRLEGWDARWRATSLALL